MADWVILGGHGMLGTELTNLLANEDCLSLSRKDCDVTNLGELQEVITDAKYIINCAAYTAVDDAESNANLAYEINAIGARNSAQLAKSLKAKLVYISTDYVFPGDATIPYPEDAQPGPMSVYGRTKLAGENEIRNIYLENSFIVRTAWLYGEHGPNFVKTMVALESQKETISVVNDQIGQPTWTRDLANKTIELVKRNAPPGNYHGTSSGQTTWFDFAREIFMHVGANPDRVIPTDSSNFVRPAVRPKYSVLGHSAWHRAGIEAIQNWKDALEEAFISGEFENAG